MRFDREKLPNFMIIGAGKCGTTSLHHYFQQNPDIYICPKKETFFFLNETDREKSRKWGAVTRYEEYRDLFQNAPDGSIIGEISTVYYSHPDSARFIHQYLPDVKIIAILRDPCERAFSDYLMHQLIAGKQEINFQECIYKDNYFVKLGFYYSNLKPFYQVFDRKQIKILFYDDFRSNYRKFLRDLFQYIGARTDLEIPEGVRLRENLFAKNPILYNLLLAPSRSGRLVNRVLNRFPRQLGADIRRQIERLSAYRPSLSPADRKNLIEIYRPEILHLQDLLDRDLSKWLKV